MADYIDRNIYHDEMVKSKKQGELTPKAITLFQIHAKEVSKMFYFEFPEDREDAIMAANIDFLKYWRGFKENRVVQFKLIRNLNDGEKFLFDISNYKKFDYTARMEPKKDNEFRIGINTNKTIQNLSDVMKVAHGHAVEVSLHKVTKKITFMDSCNKDDHSIVSKIELRLNGGLLVKDEKIYEPIKVYNFKEPSKSFNHLTSLIRNAIIKHIDQVFPSEIRNGKKIRFSQMNTESDGVHGIE